jgi:hypothetical protein
MTTDIDKAIRLMKRMVKQSRARRIKVLQARIALAEIVTASKYKGQKETDE